MTSLIPEKVDTLFVNCHLATMADNALSIIEKAALAVSGETISWIGKKNDLPENFKIRCQKVIDCNNGWILPGFVDCHTHLVWGGDQDPMSLKCGLLVQAMRRFQKKAAGSSPRYNPPETLQKMNCSPYPQNG